MALLPTPLPTRKLGNDDVTAIGYGAMGIAAFYGSVDSDEDRLKVREPCMGNYSHLTHPRLC